MDRHVLQHFLCGRQDSYITAVTWSTVVRSLGQFHYGQVRVGFGQETLLNALYCPLADFDQVLQIPNNTETNIVSEIFKNKSAQCTGSHHSFI